MLREKAPNLTTSGTEDYKASNVQINNVKHQYSVLSKTVLGECRLHTSTIGELRKEQSLKITECNKPKNINNINETGLFFRLLPNKTPSLKGGCCNGRKNSKMMTVVPLVCNANETDKPHQQLEQRTETATDLKMSESFHKLCNQQKKNNHNMGYTNHLH
jgi:hypothetical protein